ncbi:MAG: alpha-glucan family phosphorylase, partial [Gammaproteobacteria bacterium]
ALLALGRCNAGDRSEPFNMAWLAVRGAAAVNGVSRLHGEVSRRIFQPLFPRWPRCEVPVGHVTNGVHMPTWDSVAADALWTGSCGKERWRGALETVAADLRQVADEALWRLRSDGRRRLVAFLNKRLECQHRGRAAAGDLVPQYSEPFDPDILTLGFARRFAEYKRTNLLLHDPGRLERLLCGRDRPVQLVVAGKAHPHDMPGRQLLHQWQGFLSRPEIRGRVVFVEDYDLGVAEHFVQGVDVWINTPRRPWEASGTSGMKVLVNGGLNLSELDGWWAEAYSPGAGWALGDGREHADVAVWDAVEAEQLYQVLENEVVPCFYRRDESGLPREWIGRMRESMASLTTRFSSNRMLREYVERYYLPLAKARRRRSVEVAAGLQDWERQLTLHWQRLHFGNVSSTRTEAGYRFEIQVYLDEMPVEAVSVELYADPVGEAGPVRQPLQRGTLLAGAANAYVYHGTVPDTRPATDYTARIVPAHADATVPHEAGFILWHR